MKYCFEIEFKQARSQATNRNPTRPSFFNIWFNFKFYITLKKIVTDTQI